MKKGIEAKKFIDDTVQSLKDSTIIDSFAGLHGKVEFHFVDGELRSAKVEANYRIKK